MDADEQSYATEDALHRLEGALKAPPATDDKFGPGWGSVAIPSDLSSEHRSLHFSPDVVFARDAAHDAMDADLRFEYMDGKAVEAASARFMCLTHFQPDHCHVPWFMEEHAHAVSEHVCSFPVMHLSVEAPFDLGEARLVPGSDARLPEPFRSPFPNESMGCVIEARCEGTDYTKMSLRAKRVAEHALRGLRAGLREDNWLPDQQVRFALGENVWFDDGASGWTRGASAASDYAPDELALRKAMGVPAASLPAAGGDEVEQNARRALVWWEHGQLAVDPLHRLLFFFFALEAILGDTGREKGRPLALRRAVLSHKRTGGFTHPGRVYWLYKDVRNAAVHGSEVPDVSKREREAFEWDTRIAVNDYLEFAKTSTVNTHDDLLALLDDDPAMPTIEERFLPPAHRAG
jgi:hypothetical protein